MNQIAKETIGADLEQEMRKSYLDYAMSVIVGRALPDVRDGLKPVHRRVLYAMQVLNNDYNKAYKKSARIVGDVIGKYHPHGDTAVYDTIVRMAQDFSMRYPLVDGQGNFGSVDGDSAAAMRYTEIRLNKIAHELLADIDKETVDFGLNYDETEKQPLVLPSRVPNLLVNGSSGIAVGMATNIPPHNLTEVINGCLALVDNENISVEELFEIIPGPDFPTKGIISGRSGIRDAYRTGRGKVHIRARAHIENAEKGDKQSIVVTELPYMVNKSRMLEKIVDLVKDKKIEGITAVRDESDKDGMRVVVELRRGEVAEVVLNNLYKHTQMQTVFGINMVALINNQPRIFNLKELLEEFIRHRREVVTRRTIFELRKARARAHVLEGLAVALSNIDEVIEMIKKSSNPAEAKSQLIGREWQAGEVMPMIERSGSTDATKPEDLAPGLGLQENGTYRLSEIQAQAILDLRLHRLTGLEKDKLHNEYMDIVAVIADLLEILEVPERLIDVVKEELIAIREEYGDERATEISTAIHDMNEEDFIVDEDVVVTLSHSGYIKSQPLVEYKAQRRGGRGKSATATKDEDFIDNLFIASMHDTMLCFSNHGQVYWLKVYQFPQAGRQSKGKPIVNLLPLSENEVVTAIRPIREYTEGHHIVMATRLGIIKKCLLTDFSRPRANGIRAVSFRDDDQLIDVAITDGTADILLFSNVGKAVRFSESQLRPLGRTARGVMGINLAENESLISMKVCQPDDAVSAVMIATEHGYGKRTMLSQYPSRSRNTKGVISIQTTDRNGLVVAADLVNDNDEMMLITDNGVLIRTKVNQVTVVGRNTQGVRLINLGKGERLINLARVDESEEGVDLEDVAAPVGAEVDADEGGLGTNKETQDSDVETGEDAVDSQQENEDDENK